MRVFGPKKPCSRCGKQVKKPGDTAQFLCPHCGQPGPWASETQVSAWSSQESARARYGELLAQMTGPALPVGDGQALAQARAAAGYTSEELSRIHLQAFEQKALPMVADDLLTPEEGADLSSVMTVLGLDWDAIAQADRQLYDRLFVSSINGGQLPEVASPHILQKQGEVVHFECAASLMKEVAVREYQGGYQGFSIPIEKTGMRYRVGGSRGHSVEVGTTLNVADTGMLSITNKRAVYAGTRKTMDMPYSKLVNLSVYRDGIQFHMSNRVNASIFTVAGGTDILAAIINAAAQRAE